MSIFSRRAVLKPRNLYWCSECDHLLQGHIRFYGRPEGYDEPFTWRLCPACADRYPEVENEPLFEKLGYLSKALPFTGPVTVEDGTNVPATTEARLLAANQLIAAIAGCGRRFFYHEKSGRVARFEFDHRGYVVFRDEYSDKLVPAYYSGYEWRGFTGGGTMRTLVEQLADFVWYGMRLRRPLGRYPTWYSNGDPWGYGSDMDLVRKSAVELGLINPSPKETHAHSTADGATVPTAA